MGKLKCLPLGNSAKLYRARGKQNLFCFECLEFREQGQEKMASITSDVFSCPLVSGKIMATMLEESINKCFLFFFGGGLCLDGWIG